MQTISRNEDTRRQIGANGRPSRNATTIQASVSSLQYDNPGEEIRRYSPPSRPIQTIGTTGRLSTSYHANNGESPKPLSISPMKCSSMHDNPHRKPVVGRRASMSSNNTESSRSTARRSIASESVESKPPDKRKNNRPGSVSPFLRNTHKDLKNQIAKLQSHIKFIQELATMNDAKRIDLLFQMIDRDGGGTVDAEELAAAMRRNDELSFSDSIEKAIDMVAMFDKDGNLHMDRDEFRNYVAAMVQELGVTLPDFTEFLIVQLLLSEETPEEKEAGDLAREHINEEVKKRQELLAALSSNFLSEAFEMLDDAKCGEVPFQKVARALHAATKTENKSKQKSLSILLMIDDHDTRVLNYDQFGRFIISVSRVTGKSYNETADDLMYTLESQNSWEETSWSIESNDTKDDFIDTVDDLTNRRLRQLFILWDVDGSGNISCDELANGLGTFQRASGINVDPKAIAQALIVGLNDNTNGINAQLYPKEFAQAMILYTKQFDIEIHTLIDFMCSTAGNGQRVKNHVGTGLKIRQSGGQHVRNDAPFGDFDFWEDF